MGAKSIKYSKLPVNFLDLDIRSISRAMRECTRNFVCIARHLSGPRIVVSFGGLRDRKGNSEVRVYIEDAISILGHWAGLEAKKQFQ